MKKQKIFHDANIRGRPTQKIQSESGFEFLHQRDLMSD